MRVRKSFSLWPGIPFFFLAWIALLASPLAQAELSLPSVQGMAGSSVVVPIEINSAVAITALQFDIVFDDNLLSIVGPDSVLPGEATPHHTLGSSQDAGRLTIVIFSSSLEGLPAGRIVLGQIVFNIDGQAAPASEVQLRFLNVQASNSDGESVALNSLDGTVTVSGQASQPENGQNRLVFPQIGNGTFDGGSFAVGLIFVNRTQVAGSASVELFKSDGSPLLVTLTDGRMGSQFLFEISAGGSAFLMTDGTGDLSAGYAVLDATAPLGGTALFIIRDPSDSALTEAGVGAAPRGSAFSIPVIFERNVADTGVAFANTNAAATSINLILRDSQGIELEAVDLNLAAGEHQASFATELFDFLTGLQDFQGSVEIRSSISIPTIALKQQGILLTTFPVILLN